MSLQVRLKNGKPIRITKLRVGDELLCEDGSYYPVRSILLTVQKFRRLSLSNFVTYVVPNSWKLLTTNGFKLPDKNDILIGYEDIKPRVVECEYSWKFRKFRVILIDKRPVTPEGIAIDFGV